MGFLLQGVNPPTLSCAHVRAVLTLLPQPAGRSVKRSGQSNSPCPAPGFSSCRSLLSEPGCCCHATEVPPHSAPRLLACGAALAGSPPSVFSSFHVMAGAGWQGPRAGGWTRALRMGKTLGTSWQRV